MQKIGVNIMNKFIPFSIGLLLGAVGGFFGGYYLSKNKYLSMADKEIESVRKVYEKHFSNKEENTSKPQEKKSLENPVNSSIDKKNYKNYAGLYNGDKDNESDIISVIPEKSIGSPKAPKKPKLNKTPYVISPEEYRDSDYEAETLIYYSDKILADSDNNIIHNPNELIGPEALSTFGRYMDDTVYVRDDSKQLDYEIIWDSRKFSTVANLAGDKTLSDD